LLEFERTRLKTYLKQERALEVLGQNLTRPPIGGRRRVPRVGGGGGKLVGYGISKQAVGRKKGKPEENRLKKRRGKESLWGRKKKCSG